MLFLSLPALLALTALAYAQDGGENEPAAPAEINVFVLGKTQLLETPNGFPEFCEENASRTRAELRRDVVAQLKAIAEKERPALLEAIGSPKQVKHLWLVNAVVAQMSLADAKALSESDAVGGVFRAGVIPEWRAQAAEVKQLTEVLEAVEREPFTTKGKEIPGNLKALNVPKVWEKLGITGEGSLVVSFDNGLDYRHTDLRDRKSVV